MDNKYRCNLNDLFALFEENISASDILSAKMLAEISAAIVKCRIDMGLTQKKFADFLGVTQGMVSKWEGSDYNFSVKALAEIAVKLNLDLEVKLRKRKAEGVIGEDAEFISVTSGKREFITVENEETFSTKKVEHFICPAIIRKVSMMESNSKVRQCRRCY